MDTPDTGYIHTLDRVLSMVVHRFGNSLNSHNMTLEVLLRNLDDFEHPQITEFLERALRQTKQQQRLLSALKAYSGQSVGKVKEVPFLVFWQHLHRSLATRFENTAIRFDSWQQLNAQPVIMEVHALCQALHLLLDNAVDAVIDRDDQRITLTASVHPSRENRIVIQVSDNGPGIPDRLLGSVFTPLFSTRQDRFGLGLPLAKKIITNLFGGLRVFQGQPEGVTAEVWLRTGHDPGMFIKERSEEAAS